VSHNAPLSYAPRLTQKFGREATTILTQGGSVAPDNQNDYWLIKLGASRLLPVAFSAGGIRKFRFRLTGAAELQAAQN
jgi:hypothetical protein